DANPGATRSGTLTIAGQTLTVTQAGSNYVTANLLPTVVPSGLKSPAGLAVDRQGNVYIADGGNNAIYAWIASTQQFTSPVTFGLNNPQGVAVSATGIVYIADGGHNAIKEWNPSTGQLSTLVSSGLNDPQGVAVDAAGNVYIADTMNSAVKEW